MSTCVEKDKKLLIVYNSRVISETITRNIIENSFETTVIDNCSAEYGIGFVVHDNNSDPLNKSFCEFVINIYPDSYQSKKILSKFIIKSLFSYIDLQS